MAEDQGERSFDPTPRRREAAREQGQIAKSHDLASAAVLVGGILVLQFAGQTTADALARLMQDALGGEAWLEADTDRVVSLWYSLISVLAAAVLPLLATVAVIAIAANVAQVGFLFLPEKAGFDPERLNPLSGLGRLFSMSNLVRIAFGLGKVALVGSLAAYDLWTKKESILAVSALTIPQAAAFTAQITLAICLKISIALLLLALLDYFYQWQQIESQLRMTKEEMKEEMKSSEGDPLIAARRKLIQKQLAKNRLKAAVPKATLAITNPTELAIAIRYDIETMPAPIVVAKGAGVLAQQIRRLCLEHNIPLVERKELARALYDSVEVNKPIPLEHYAAVAEVLSYVYQLKGWKAPQRRAAA